MAKIVINVPDNVYEQMLVLQGYYGTTNLVNTLTLGAHVLNWMKENNEVGAQICALDKDDGVLTISKLPVKRINTDVNKIKDILKDYNK